MYNIDQSTDAGNNNGVAGIQENFELVGIKYEGTGKDNTGTKGLRFHFKKGEKFNFTHNVFPIDEEKVASWARKDKEGNEMPRKEKIAAAYKDQAASIKHILTKFMPEDEIIIKGANFEEFAKNVIKLMGNKFEGKKLRLKLVYNTKGYLSFPKFAFIEGMDVPKAQSKLSINPQYDKLTKDVPDTELDEDTAVSTSTPSKSSSKTEETDF